MNADLLAMFGGGLPGAATSRHSTVNEGKNLLSFKAGKMTTELKPNGKYLVTGDARRGEIVLMYYTSSPSTNSSNATAASSSSPTLKFEWKDRRSRQTVDELTFLPSDSNNVKFVPISTGKENDRVYLLQYSNSDTRYFYYMQEKESDGDLDNVVLINKYLSNFKKAATAAGDETYLASLTSTSSTTPQQIDALSSILENLVPPSSSAPAATPIESSAAAPATGTGALTLADLQGAMAGLAQPVAPLTEVLNPNLVEESGILSNPDVQEKLLSLLPPNTCGKNKEAYLKEHLTSPQCLESIKTLQNALNGQSGNLQNILLNFQLDNSVLLDGAAGNPIEAFLESVVRSMKKEKEEGEGKDDSKMEE